MVGDHDRIRAGVARGCGVFGVQDTFYNQLAFPHGADMGEMGPVEVLAG